MLRVPRMTDRYKITFGDISFLIAPLSRGQKSEINQCSVINEGNTTTYLFESQALYLKYGLKKIEGAQDFHGKPYRLSFAENGGLTDDCLDEVLNICGKEEIMAVAWQLLEGVPEEITDPVHVKNVKLDKMPLRVKIPKSKKYLEGVALEILPMETDDS
jgi:hypothetical protein